MKSGKVFLTFLVIASNFDLYAETMKTGVPVNKVASTSSVKTKQDHVSFELKQIAKNVKCSLVDLRGEAWKEKKEISVKAKVYCKPVNELGMRCHESVGKKEFDIFPIFTSEDDVFLGIYNVISEYRTYGCMEIGTTKARKFRSFLENSVRQGGFVECYLRLVIRDRACLIFYEHECYDAGLTKSYLIKDWISIADYNKVHGIEMPKQEKLTDSGKKFGYYATVEKKLNQPFVILATLDIEDSYFGSFENTKESMYSFSAFDGNSIFRAYALKEDLGKIIREKVAGGSRIKWLLKCRIPMLEYKFGALENAYIEQAEIVQNAVE